MLEVPVKEALDGALSDGAGRVDGDAETFVDSLREGQVPVGIELPVEDEAEAALLNDLFDVGFWRCTHDEEWLQPQEAAHGELEREFVVGDVVQGVLDFGSVGDAVALKDSVKIVVGRRPYPSSVLANVS